MEKLLARQYYSPNGYWKGFGAIRKLARAAKVSENVAKRWLMLVGAGALALGYAAFRFI